MMIYVKPAPGGRVRMPERGSRLMSNEGAWVPRNDYYERLLISGDIAVCDVPATRAAVKKKSQARQDHHQAAQAAATPAAGPIRSAKEN